MPSRSWFSRALGGWYALHRRDLPWRRTTDPYAIWLSEVMLQQTRVDQGLAYWLRFVERWPTVRDLAAADEQQVLKEWQGLGYYSRARNLRTAAQQVVHDHGGVFPRSHTELRTLKGVGDYTAAAIASICYGEPEAVVDGNVYRVLARVFGISTAIDSVPGKRAFQELAQDLLDPARPGDHNQAVMELGAMVCTPRDPDCGACPLRSKCIARAEERIAQLPVKSKKQAVRLRHFNYLIIRNGRNTLMRQRAAKDIWQGLWELPLVETARSANTPLLRKELAAIASSGTWVLSKDGPMVEHVLSHQRIAASFWACVPPKGWKKPGDWIAVKEADLASLPVHRLMERWLLEQRAK